MRTIRTKILLAHVIPASGIVVAFGYFAYSYSRYGFEEELGYRLIAIAQAASTQLKGLYVKQLIDRPTGEDLKNTRNYRNLRGKLVLLRQKSGMRSIYVFDRQLRNLVDDTGTIPVGAIRYARGADKTELEEVFTGRPRTSTLFTGEGGIRYKSGFAPISYKGKVIAIVGVDGSASFFEGLVQLRWYLIIIGAFLILLVIMTSLLLASRLVRPINRLVKAAQAIGRGEFQDEISVGTNDEIAFLGKTMNEMKRNIEARDRQLQMMLSGIAHEVRNPLGGIELFAGLLREELVDDEKKLKRVLRIERELGYLKRVVTEFLEYARQIPLTREAVEPLELLEEVHALLAGDMKQTGIHFTLSHEEGLGQLYCDREKMRRALLNIMKNAIEAMSEGGVIDIALSKSEDGRLSIAIKDDGKGIKEDKLNEIFTPFYTSKEKGTGLGMAFVKKIVEEHDGLVFLTSRPGEGTTVTISMPMSLGGKCPSAVRK